MRAYAAAIWQCRYFWFSLVCMDLRTRYRRSVLGLGWSLLNPIAMTAVLCMVFHNLFQMKVEEYGPFLLSGLTFWNFLSASITRGCTCSSPRDLHPAVPDAAGDPPIAHGVGGGLRFQPLAVRRVGPDVDVPRSRQPSGWLAWYRR